MITVRIEPDNEVRTLEKINTTQQLLTRLNLKSTQALVIRGEELLTPDRHIVQGDEITVRKVVSLG